MTVREARMRVKKFIGNVVFGGGVTFEGAATFEGAVTASSAQIRQASQALTASGAITIKSGLVTLAHNTTAIAATKAAPAVGDVLYIVNTSASGTAAHTVTLPSGVTWDGTNRVVTLDAPGEAIAAIAVSATRFFVFASQGTVSYSSP